MEYAIECVRDCHSSIPNAFKIRQYVAVGIEKFAVDPFRKNPCLRRDLCRRLEVYATVLPWCRKKVFHEFDKAEDLQEALVASCCLVPLAGLPFPLRKTGEYVCDGGMVAFQPRKGERNVITVSALYFTSAHIKPTGFVPSWWGLYPSSEREYWRLYHQGFNDCIKYLVQEGFVEETALKKLRRLPPSTHRRTPVDTAVDIGTGIVFMLVLRPWALIVIYIEMLLSTAVLLFFATISMTKLGRWQNWLHSLRNVISARVILHILIGKCVPVNLERLEKHSRIYRILKPIVYA